MSLIIESFVFKLNLLSTNLTSNCTEKMCLECRELGETIMVEQTYRRLSTLPNPDDRADGTDGADDTADEAAAGRSELHRRSELR